ncbi:VOC family protein [Rhizobium sp. SGZ-381]|uniref:VOC family protein n=1 Tax=Rhizobium sp. SGZ-381 TaxID=3342800 RepID=UPI003671BF04
MKPANFVLLHVADLAASAAFYHRLFDHRPVEHSSTFAMFVMPGGFRLGLWKADCVSPKTSGDSGASEIVFTCDEDAEVEAVHADWRGKGVTILQSPETMDFGHTFTAEDPDGHRLRVYHVAANPA